MYLLLLVGMLYPDGRLRAQRHDVTDRSLAASLLSSAVPMPPGVLSSRTPGDFVRWELQLSRGALGGEATPRWAVGASTGGLWRDTMGTYAGVAGVRVGFRAEGEHPARALSVVELQAAAWSLRERSALPDAGIQLSLGMGDIDTDPKGPLGVRAPLVFFRRIPHGRISLAAVPTLAGRRGSPGRRDAGWHIPCTRASFPSRMSGLPDPNPPCSI